MTVSKFMLGLSLLCFSLLCSIPLIAFRWSDSSSQSSPPQNTERLFSLYHAAVSDLRFTEPATVSMSVQEENSTQREQHKIVKRYSERFRRWLVSLSSKTLPILRPPIIPTPSPSPSLLPLIKLSPAVKDMLCWSVERTDVYLNDSVTSLQNDNVILTYATLDAAKTFCELLPLCTGIVGRPAPEISANFSASEIRYILKGGRPLIVPHRGNQTNNSSNSSMSGPSGPSTVNSANMTTWFKKKCKVDEEEATRSVLPRTPIRGFRESVTSPGYYQSNFTCSQITRGKPTSRNITHIEIFGERNSGTSFLYHLLRTNTQGLNVTIGQDYKHMRLDQVQFQNLSKSSVENTLYVHITKDLFSWLRSMHKMPYHFWPLRVLPFEGFLLSHWDPLELPLRKWRMADFAYWAWRDDYYENVFQLRAVKLQTFLTIQPCLPNVITLRYQDLNEDPTAILENLRSRFHLPLIPALNVTTCFLKHNTCSPNSEKIRAEKAEYYRQKAYLREYSNISLQIARLHVDQELEKKFGYDYSDILGSSNSRIMGM